MQKIIPLATINHVGRIVPIQLVIAVLPIKRRRHLVPDHHHVISPSRLHQLRLTHKKRVARPTTCILCCNLDDILLIEVLDRLRKHYFYGCRFTRKDSRFTDLKALDCWCGIVGSDSHQNSCRILTAVAIINNIRNGIRPIKTGVRGIHKRHTGWIKGKHFCPEIVLARRTYSSCSTQRPHTPCLGPKIIHAFSSRWIPRKKDSRIQVRSTCWCNLKGPCHLVRYYK